VSKKLSSMCQSVSEGLGEERYVAVVAKGTVRPACRWGLWAARPLAGQFRSQQLYADCKCCIFTEALQDVLTRLACSTQGGTFH
jgi:hypothetical protein